MEEHEREKRKRIVRDGDAFNFRRFLKGMGFLDKPKPVQEKPVEEVKGRWDEKKPWVPPDRFDVC